MKQSTFFTKIMVSLFSSLFNFLSRFHKDDENEEKNTVTKEEAMRRLMFASLLMYKIDDAVKYSGITE